MPLIHNANGPLSATGPVSELQLDDLEMDIDPPQSQFNHESIDIHTLVEEKADPR